MRKILLIGITAIFALSLAIANVYAGTPQTIQTTVNATVGSTFSIAFETNGTYVSYPGASGLTAAVDPASDLNYLDNHSTLKPDIGIIVKSNENIQWFLKTATAGGSLAGKLLYYLPQPTVDGTVTNGTLTNPVPGEGNPWPKIPNGTIYTSGLDKINTPNGTYFGMSIGVTGSGLAPGSAACNLIFTLTQTP
ncbi:MAG: hypothetical protein JW994_06845 [Candidatus Omnitrophica bacterium]|nr:hypothetical protein [Candidatus Omnitrophota bacterium]